MKVTILYRVAPKTPVVSTDLRRWYGELSEAEYHYFKQYRSEYKNQYCDIREEYPEGDEAFDNDICAQEELSALNYEILNEALHQWCSYAMLDILEDLHVLKENADITEHDIDIVGCRIG